MKKKILFVFNTKASFILQDLEILKEAYDVEEGFVGSYVDAFVLASPMTLAKFDIVYFWFASLNFVPIFFVSKLLNKKIFVVAGGFDVANIPEFNYGAGTEDPLRLFLRRAMFHGAHHVTNVSSSNENDLMKTVPNLKSPHTIINFGFKDPQSQIVPLIQRPKKIITIGAINKITYERKGMRFFAELSRLMPEWDFVAVGKWDKEYRIKLEEVGGKNLHFTGFLSDEAFSEEVQNSRFYLQLSHHEAFGLSVVDAGLRGVYPIVFDKFSLPELVIEIGSITKFKDLEAVKTEILRVDAVSYEPTFVKKKFLQRFSWERKKKSLLDVVAKYS